MKRITLLFLLLIAANVKAQDLNIHPSLLSALLQPSNAKSIEGFTISVDDDEDGTITQEELNQVAKLFISNKNVTSLQGIEYLHNLNELDCSHNPLSQINTAIYTSPFVLKCDYTSVTSLIITSNIVLSGVHHCAQLTNLTFLGGQTSAMTLDLSGLTALEVLQCQNCQEVSLLHLDDCLNLRELITTNTAIGPLNITGFTNLKKLKCENGGISSITGIETALALEAIYVDENPLSSLHLAGLPALKIVSAQMCSINSPIDLSTSTLLQKVYLGSNEIPSILLPSENLYLAEFFADTNSYTSLDLGYAPVLSLLDISATALSFLDLSGCTSAQLSSIQFGVNAAVPVYINLKNGRQDTINVLDWGGNPNITFCTDEGEDNYILQNIAAFGLADSSLNVNTYCTETPGGNFNAINGTMSYNPDGNGCNNSNPVNFSRLNLTGPGSSASVLTAGGGGYSLFVAQSGTYTVTPVIDSNLFIVTPQSATISFANNNNNTTLQDFCISPNGSHSDVEIMVSPLHIAQPGFDATYFITYKNKGNQILSGDVVFSYDDAVMDYITSTVTPTTANESSLMWAYTNLQPFESRTISLTLNMNGPMETPALNNGDHLNFTASISPTTGDEAPGDNTFTLEQTLAGSFDPNDITCLEGDTEHPDNIGKYLHYNINFENTGTAPATFIVVKDMIDTAKFDLASLQLITASHTVKTRISGNKVEFYFDAINLGPNQKGNVLFKIKTLPTLSVNTSVTQNANIYFDYNWPITTNDATTTFQLLSRGDFAQDMSVKIYPNPSSSVVNITAATPISSLQLYDLQGRLLEAVSPKINEARVDISRRRTGIYFMKISTENGVKIGKIIKY